MNELIEFKDLPNTDTPINAENLNSNFENLNSNFENLNSNFEYSIEEQVVGKWIDGKPLYRKVINITSTSNISAGITNVDIIIKMECIVSNEIDTQYRNLPWLYNSTDTSWMGGFYYNKSNDTIGFQVGSALGNITKGHIILEYTKTTD